MAEKESSSNPLKTREVFQFKIKKYFKFWVWGFFDDVMIGVGITIHFMTSSADPMSRICGSKLYWIIGYNTSLLSP